jgi:hypothetical protein
MIFISERKRSLWEHRRRCEDIIEIYLKEERCESMGCIMWLKIRSSDCECSNKPSGFAEAAEYLDQLGDSQLLMSSC